MIDNIIYEMIALNGSDTRRINHALKVYGLARCIAGRENVADEEMLIICVSAVLHDIAIKHCEAVYGNCGGKLQEKEGPSIALPILKRCTNDTDLIDRVCFIIAHHHTYTGINDLCHQIIIEADFLVNYDEGEFSSAAYQMLLRKHFKTQTGKALSALMFGI